MKKMKTLTALLMTAAMAFSMTACGSSKSESAPAGTETAKNTESAGETSKTAELEDFDIVLDWYPNAVHSFIYVAMEKGYYAEEGLDVHVQFPSNTNDAISLTAAGKADAGLWYQPNAITTAVNQNIPLKILGTVVQHPLNIVMSMKDSNINGAKDLVGKVVGTTTIEESESYLMAMMEYVGCSYDDLTLQDVGFDLNTALITGNVDATIGGYINHEYPTLLQEGYDVTYFDITKEGVPDYEELVLVTGEKQTANESDKLARFIRASKKGYQDMIDDPEGSLQILLDNQDEANYPLDPAIEKASIEILLPLMADSSENFLEINKDSWVKTAAWLYEKGMLDKEADIDALLTDIQ